MPAVLNVVLPQLLPHPKKGSRDGVGWCVYGFSIYDYTLSILELCRRLQPHSLTTFAPAENAQMNGATRKRRFSKYHAQSRIEYFFSSVSVRLRVLLLLRSSEFIYCLSFDVSYTACECLCMQNKCIHKFILTGTRFQLRLVVVPENGWAVLIATDSVCERCGLWHTLAGVRYGNGRWKTSVVL